MGHGVSRLVTGGLLAFLVLMLVPRVGHAAVACGAADGDNTQACTIDPAIDPAALCNDGTTPKFSIRPGKGSGVNTWIIWLEGGGQCFDQISCTIRAYSPSSGLLTSNGYKATDGVGVLRSSSLFNPDFYNATTVQIHYCSSDDWTGGYAAQGAFVANNPATWNFQGRRIALAAIRSLTELPYNFAQATTIVLGGSSAGGIGATDDANDILPILPAAPTRLLLNDAGFTLNIGQYDASIPSPYVYQGTPNAFDVAYTDALKLWGGRGDALCAATAGTTQQQVNCYDTSYVLQNGYVTLPTFVTESQIDSAQETLELCPNLYGYCSLPTDPASMQGIYATQFGVSMAALLMGAGTGASYSVASPDVYAHQILANQIEFLKPFLIQGGATTPESALHSWLMNPTVRSVQLGTGPGVN